MHSYLYLFWRFIVVTILCIGIMGMAKAQTNETFPANTYVIDMGVTPQTIANSLKPYGLVYALLQSGVPVKWSISGTKAKDKDADPIIVHPDVRKMLLTAKAYAEGGRALAMFCALLLDKAHYHPDEKVRKDSDEMLSLLTPIVKAFLTDNGHIATNACMQVFGGHG